MKVQMHVSHKSQVTSQQKHNNIRNTSSYLSAWSISWLQKVNIM